MVVAATSKTETKLQSKEFNALLKEPIMDTFEVIALHRLNFNETRTLLEFYQASHLFNDCK